MERNPPDETENIQLYETDLQEEENPDEPENIQQLQEPDFLEVSNPDDPDNLQVVHEEGSFKKDVRWRKANPKNWKINKNKTLKSSGLPYTSKKGKLMPAKVPKPVDCSNCFINVLNILAMMTEQ